MSFSRRRIKAQQLHAVMGRHIGPGTGMQLDEALEIVLGAVRHLEFGVMPAGFEWNNDIVEACGVCENVLSELTGEQEI